MIYLLDISDPLYTRRVAQFLSACAQEPLSGAAVQTRFRVYGGDTRVGLFWVQLQEQEQKEIPTAAVALAGGQLTVCDSAHSDSAELSAFLQLLGGYALFSASPRLAALVAPPGESRTLTAMVYSSNAPRPAVPVNAFASAMICDNPAPGAIFALFCAVDDFFARHTQRDAWYVYMSHLLRHQLGFCAGIVQDGVLASTGGVYAQGDTHAILSGLATRTDCRRQGYGASIMRHLIRRSLDAGKTPALYTADSGLCDYYRRLGFVESHSWVEVAGCTCTQPQVL